MRALNCCREIRTQLLVSNFHVGDVVEGYNSITDQIDRVIVVKPMKDHNMTVVIKYSDKQFKKYRNKRGNK